MAYIIGYSRLTSLTVPATAWDEAWFALASWKGYMQSFPGYQAIRISARALDNGDVRVHTAVSFEYPEQLEEWRTGPFTIEHLLTSIDEPAYDVVGESVEDLS